jgi:hypothetical protein
MPIKKHYIQEWAALRGWRQADLQRKLDGLDKSLVSRWWRGTVPGDEYLQRLAVVFDLPRPEMLLRHPDEVWALNYAEDLNDAERSAVRTVVDSYRSASSK